MVEDWKEKAKDALHALYSWPKDEVSIFHHNDTDGITSGAILTKAFKRKGYTVTRISLEKPYPAVLEEIFQAKGNIIIFADFAGRIAPLLASLNRGRNLVVILDHHVAKQSDDPKVLNCDPDLFGLKGDRDISASTTCYLFATLMDEKNRDMAWMGALGAVGDEFFVDGELVSENLKVTMEAVKQGKVLIDASKKEGKRYIFCTAKKDMAGDQFEEYLDTLGGAGFYRNGPTIGVSVCLNGFSKETDAMFQELKTIKDGIFEDEINRLKSGALVKTAHIQWFHVHKRFSPMGVKMVGAFCDVIRHMDFIAADKYIAGFQVIPNKIPGLGEIVINQVKISMRVSPVMEKQIRNGEKMGLTMLLPEATERLGGFSDACHSLTAATTIDIGKEEQLIDEMEKILH